MRFYGLISLSSILLTNMIFAFSSTALADESNTLESTREARNVHQYKFVSTAGNNKRYNGKIRRRESRSYVQGSVALNSRFLNRFAGELDRGPQYPDGRPQSLRGSDNGPSNPNGRPQSPSIGPTDNPQYSQSPGVSDNGPSNPNGRPQSPSIGPTDNPQYPQSPGVSDNGPSNPNGLPQLPRGPGDAENPRGLESYSKGLGRRPGGARSNNPAGPAGGYLDRYLSDGKSSLLSHSDNPDGLSNNAGGGSIIAAQGGLL